MRDRQQQIIDGKFRELFQKLDERKNQISKELMHKYESAIFKVNDKVRMCKDYLEELSKAKEHYQSIIAKLADDRFLKEDASTDQIEVLDKIPEVDKFMHEVQLKLKTFQLSQSKIL